MQYPRASAFLSACHPDRWASTWFAPLISRRFGSRRSGLRCTWRRRGNCAPAREAAARCLRVAEQLGAEIVTVTCGAHFASRIIELAQARNVARILVGRPRRRGWRRLLKGSVVDAIVAGSGGIDVHIVADPMAHPRRQPLQRQRSAQGIALDARSDRGNPPWLGYLAGGLITTGCTAVAAVMSVWLAPTNLAMVYLSGGVPAATRFDRRASVVAAVLGTVAFDFFFIPPIYSFAVSDTEYLLTAAKIPQIELSASPRLSGRPDQNEAYQG